jgi:hypothetical protein
MLNLAGPAFDFGSVLFAVLQDCEHQRPAFAPDELAERLLEVARAKLAEIRRAYDEAGGAESYWAALEREVLATTMPQYIAAARRQNRLESTDFDLWRQGDPIARTAYAVVGLTLGGLIVAAPFIPIFEDAFAFALAAVGLAYPEIKRLFFSLRQSRLLNRLIVAGERYQKDGRIHYVADSALFAELDAARTRAVERVAAAERGVAGESVAPPRAVSEPATAVPIAGAEPGSSAVPGLGPQRRGQASHSS